MTMLRVVLLGGITATMWGQAMVEYGLGIAAAGTAGAPGQAASRGIAGIFSNLQKTLNATTEAAKAAPAAPAAPATAKPRVSRAGEPAVIPPPPPKPVVVYEDPAGITAGMERAELLSRFGAPAMCITTGGGRESMTYSAKDKSFEVELRDGKVSSVQSKTKPKQTAVVILK